jgi:hypothetical protein
VQSQEGFLENIVGLLPPVNGRIGAQHFPGQPAQALTGVLQERITSLAISGAHAVKPVLQLRCGILAVAHAGSLTKPGHKTTFRNACICRRL